MMSKCDGFVKSPISALRFISKSLRRTPSTPHVSKFARLELGTFYKAVGKSTFYEFIKFGSTENIRPDDPNGVRTLADGGTWNTIAGQPTDDSEMALLLGRSDSRFGD